ncbi:MAG TPA: carbohydrate ABC transporter permease [Aestuariivirgaceae bacterium]|nr:carbohydrate ABC transporter permease [Aestuariivirgaceae bacterium]
MAMLWLRPVLKYALIAAIVAFFIFPIYWMLITSIKPPEYVIKYPPHLYPPEITFDAYYEALTRLRGGAALVNSLIIAAVSTLISMVLGTIAGHAFARYPIGGFHLPFWILSTRMMPAVAAIIPLFLLVKQFGLMDTHAAVIALHLIVTLPFAVWMMRGFFIDVPKELEEAALIDGCSKWGAFVRVALPVVAPGLAVTTLFCFIFSWNEFVFALILTRRNATTLPVLISGLHSSHGVLWSELSALAAVALIPITILALFAQKHLVRGMTMGAVK